jgi:hypothetical protein
MNIYNALINFILFGLMFIFPLMIYLNLRKYKTAALGRLFSNKSQKSGSSSSLLGYDYIPSMFSSTF